MAGQIPIVDYLILDPAPHLRAHQCANCGARYFDRRNACAACGGATFIDVDVPTDGELRSFTIVHRAAEGVPTPFAAGVIDCHGTSVRGNLVNTPPDPENVRLGMKVRLTTYSIGNRGGVDAVGYGFEPA